jgi:hypothetical protein
MIGNDRYNFARRASFGAMDCRADAREFGGIKSDYRVLDCFAARAMTEKRCEFTEIRGEAVFSRTR